MLRNQLRHQIYNKRIKGVLTRESQRGAKKRNKREKTHAKDHRQDYMDRSEAGGRRRQHLFFSLVVLHGRWHAVHDGLRFNRSALLHQVHIRILHVGVLSRRSNVGLRRSRELGVRRRRHSGRHLRSASLRSDGAGPRVRVLRHHAIASRRVRQWPSGAVHLDVAAVALAGAVDRRACVRDHGTGHRRVVLRVPVVHASVACNDGRNVGQRGRTARVDAAGHRAVCSIPWLLKGWCDGGVGHRPRHRRHGGCARLR